MKFIKKMLCGLLMICILTSMFPVFADNTITIGNIDINVKNDVVNVNAKVTGYTSNMPFSVKVLTMSGGVEYIDSIIPTYGNISFSFTPKSASKGDTLIVKVSGTTTMTKTFKYDKDTTADNLSDKERALLEQIKEEYGKYTDILGDIEFNIEMSSESGEITLTLKAPTMKSSDNIWKNKDSERWNAYLEKMADLITEKTKKDVRIMIYDSNKKLVDNKKYSSDGSSSKVITTLIRNLNSKYSSMKVGSSTYKIRYSRSDMDNVLQGSNLLYIDAYSSSFDGTKVKAGDIGDITAFFDKVYEYAKETYFEDITFQLIDKDKKIYNSYIYFAESNIKPEDKYGPLDAATGNFPLNLFDYGNNSCVIPSSAVSIKIDGKNITATADSLSDVTKVVSKLSSSKPKQVVIGIDPTIDPDVIKIVVNKSIVDYLRGQNATLMINTPFIQANIDCGKLTSSDGISLTVKKSEEMPFGENLTLIGPAYDVSLNHTGGGEIKTTNSNIMMVYRLPADSMVNFTDARMVNIYKHNPDTYEWTQYNSNWKSGLQGMIFIYNGNGLYGAAQSEFNFIDMKGHWAESVVNVIAAKQMIKGVGGNMYNPGDSISRAQYVAIISRHLGISPKNSSNYQDVTEGSWSYNEVNAARDYNILPQTMTSNNFLPNQPITREEMAYIAVKAYVNVTRENVKAGTLLFKDANLVSDWAKDAVAIAQEKKIMNGTNEGFCKPKNYASRAEAAQVIYNLLTSEGFLS